MQMLKYIYLKWFLAMSEDDFHMQHAARHTHIDMHVHAHASCLGR